MLKSISTVHMQNMSLILRVIPHFDNRRILRNSCVWTDDGFYRRSLHEHVLKGVVRVLLEFLFVLGRGLAGREEKTV